MMAAPPRHGATEAAGGGVLENFLFTRRLWVLAACALLTLFFGWQTSRLQLNASFEKTIPANHPYIRNFLTWQP